MWNSFLAGAIIATVIGFFFLSNITSGVGLVCTGCLLGIIARMKQAEDHHKHMIEFIIIQNNK